MPVDSAVVTTPGAAATTWSPTSSGAVPVDGLAARAVAGAGGAGPLLAARERHLVRRRRYGVAGQARRPHGRGDQRPLVSRARRHGTSPSTSAPRVSWATVLASHMNTTSSTVATEALNRNALLGVSVTKLHACSAIATGTRGHRRSRISPSWATEATSRPSWVKTRRTPGRGRPAPRASAGRRATTRRPGTAGGTRSCGPARPSGSRGGRWMPCGGQGRAEQAHVAGVGERRQVHPRVVAERPPAPGSTSGPATGASRVVGQPVPRVADVAGVERGPLLRQCVGVLVAAAAASGRPGRAPSSGGITSGIGSWCSRPSSGFWKFAVW